MSAQSPQQKVLAIAAGEIGYSRWTDPGRGTKYARETQPALWPGETWLLANGISYCDIFITWCFWKAGLLSILPAGASYNTDVRAAHGGRVPLSDAKPGDVLVFDWNRATAATNHVGLLERVLPSGSFQTIEGNTSPGASGSQGNGGVVARRVRARSTVRYVIRPRWDDVAQVVSAPVAHPSQLAVDGIAGRATALQIQKRLLTVDGTLAVDGRIGPHTIRTLQRFLGMTADGRFDGQNATTRAAWPSALPDVLPLGRGGSRGARALQAYTTGCDVDGLPGPSTVRALQAMCNRYPAFLTGADRGIADRRVRGAGLR